MDALLASAATSTFRSGPYLEGLLQVAGNGEMSTASDEATERWVREMCERIVQRRKDLGLYLEDVAARLTATGKRIGKDGYARWEAKGPPLTLGTSRLGELAVALECAPEWILHGDVQRAPAPRLVHQGPGEDEVFGEIRDLAGSLGAVEVRLARIEASQERLEQLVGKQESQGTTRRSRK